MCNSNCVHACTCRKVMQSNSPIFNTVPQRDGSKARIKLANFFIILFDVLR